MVPGPDDPEILVLDDPDLIPPDPNEPPPVELWSAVGDIPPWATMLVLLAWAVIFLALALRGELGDTAALVAWGGSTTGGSGWAAAWRALASTFVHAGAAHVFFNALSLLVVGPGVERLFGRAGFWVAYAAGGAAASLASLAWRAARGGEAFSVSVGGSGVIFALGGALLVAAFRLRHRLAVGRARAFGGALLLLLAQSLAAGFTRNSTDNMAHAAGLLAGLMLGARLPLSPRLGGPGAGVTVRLLGALSALALALSVALAVRGGLERG
jgi:rhomboid protease GluP